MVSAPAQEESNMAELINLREADKFLQNCGTELEKLKKTLTDPNRGIWSDAQRVELTNVVRAIIALKNSVADIMHNNRDGRGTPPAKPKPNSMLDRTR
jgi:hypothetical protein